MNVPPAFIEALPEIPEWQSLCCDAAQITVHRYPDDVWWVLPNDPMPAHHWIGTEFKCFEMMERFLSSRAAVGFPIKVNLQFS